MLLFIRADVCPKHLSCNIAGRYIMYWTQTMHIKPDLPLAAQLAWIFVGKIAIVVPSRRTCLKTQERLESDKKPKTWRGLNPQPMDNETYALPLCNTRLSWSGKRGRNIFLNAVKSETDEEKILDSLL